MTSFGGRPLAEAPRALHLCQPARARAALNQAASTGRRHTRAAPSRTELAPAECARSAHLMGCCSFFGAHLSQYTLRIDMNKWTSVCILWRAGTRAQFNPDEPARIRPATASQPASQQVGARQISSPRCGRHAHAPDQVSRPS